jgi:hypothetical protein
VRTSRSLMRVRYIPVAVAVALTAALGVVLGGPPASAAAPVSPAAVAAVQRSWWYVPEFSSSPVIETGTVVDSAGHAVPGATVILFPVVLGPKAGTTMTPLARSTSDSSGHFVLHLPASRDGLLKNSKSGGALNLNVMAFYPGGQTSWFAPIAAGAAPVAPAARLVMRAARPTRTGGPNDSNQPASCIYETPIILKGFSVVVGYKSSLDTNLNYTQYNYTTDVTETEGVAASNDSAYGGFSLDGTTSENDSTGVTFPNMRGAGSNNLLADGADYDQEILCGIHYDPVWDVYQDAVGGDDGTPGAGAVAAGYCFSAPADEPVIIDSTAQQTWGSGVDTGPIIGVSLSSQDGFSASGELIYQLGSESKPYCGVHNYPGASGSPAPGAIQIH